MRVLWVTSFSRDLYKVSGQPLLDSFFEHQVSGELLVGHEYLGPGIIPEQPRVRCWDMTACKRLTDFLQAHREVIPTHLGGTFERCRCKHGENPHARTHRPGCPGAWFNRNAYRWYRKVVALEYALEQAESDGFEAIVWLDADCRFRAAPSPAALASWFRALRAQAPARRVAVPAVFADVWYHQSPQRKVAETGLMGFRSGKGFQFIRELSWRYLFGTFRKDARWDDSAQFCAVRDQHPAFVCVDLARKASGHADVVCHSPVGLCIEHAKGRHGRELGLMT